MRRSPLRIQTVADANFGDEKPARVVGVRRNPRFTAVVCVDESEKDQNTGYVCLFHPTDVTPEVGDKGVLVFTRGGPGGGYWKFQKEGRQV